MNDVFQFLKNFYSQLNSENNAVYLQVLIAIIGILIGTMIPFIWKLIRNIINWFRQRKLNKDLHPFFSLQEIKKATQYFIPTQCQNVDPSREYEPKKSYAFATKEPLIPFFIRRVFTNGDQDNRFYIILGDSGMGKTTLMINLYLKYINLIRRKKYKIKLLPLGFPEIDSYISNIEDKENTILLLDAFDEDNLAVMDHRERMNDLINKIINFRVIIFTCRTQFFPTESDEPGETGIFKFGTEKGSHVFRKMYISPFDNKDIKKYLNKKFSFFNFRKKNIAKRIVENSPNLMVRPMLLSYIDDFISSKKQYENSYSIYEEMINKWIERESKRIQLNNREKFKEELYKFTKEIAMDIFENRNIRKGLFINSDDIKPFAEKHKIELNEMEMKSRSLLNRNAKGQYKFSHKSILEYYFALESLKDINRINILKEENFDIAQKFFKEMLWLKYTRPFFFDKTRFKGSFNFSKKPYFDFSNFYKKYDFPLYIKVFKDSGKLKLNYESIDRFLFKSDSLLNLNKNKLEIITNLVLYNYDETVLYSLLFFENLISLSFINSEYINLDGIEILDKLMALSFENIKVIDFHNLENLKKLSFLSMYNTRIYEMNLSETLTQLIHLNLCGNKINDISFLKNFHKLLVLGLSDNKISDINVLGNLKNLTHLFLTDNYLTDISSIGNLHNLEVLFLDNNRISDISTLMGLRKLKILSISRNTVRYEQLKIFKNEIPECEIAWINPPIEL